MRIEYNATGAKRKEIVKIVSATANSPIRYLGVPSFSYAVGNFEITVDGALIFDDGIDEKILAKVTGELSAAGFTRETQEESQNFTISLPKENFTETALKNLKAILTSKANLIKSAIGIEKVDFEISENELKFAWLDRTPSAKEFQAYSNFICKVGELAKKQKRVTAKEREVENERYAFRCFLLRIGMIGAEFKTSRKILLEKLVGNCAFKSGHRRIKTLKWDTIS